MNTPSSAMPQSLLLRETWLKSKVLAMPFAQ
jgi:hypothetical protein